MEAILSILKINHGELDEKEEVNYFDQFDGAEILELNDKTIRFRLRKNEIVEFQLKSFNEDALSKEFYSTLDNGKRFRFVLPGEAAINILESKGSPIFLSFGSMHQEGFAIHFDIISTITGDKLIPSEFYKLIVDSKEDLPLSDSVDQKISSLVDSIMGKSSDDYQNAQLKLFRVLSAHENKLVSGTEIIVFDMVPKENFEIGVESHEQFIFLKESLNANLILDCARQNQDVNINLSDYFLRKEVEEGKTFYRYFHKELNIK